MTDETWSQKASYTRKEKKNGAILIYVTSFPSAGNSQQRSIISMVRNKLLFKEILQNHVLV